MALFGATTSAQTVTTYDFEDGNALFSADSRISANVVETSQTIYNTNFDIDGKAVYFTGASNAQNGYCFAHFDFSSLCTQAAKVKVEFDAVLGNGARSRISIGDATVRGNTGNSAKTTYSNKGAIFMIGTEKSVGYINATNNAELLTALTQKWLKVTVEVDEVTKKYTYSIVDKSTGNKLYNNGTEPIAFWSSDATNCTQIDVFGYINNSQMALIDSLKITITKDEREQANYTVNFLDKEGSPIKDASVRTGAVGDSITLLPADKEPVWNNETKYIYESDNTKELTIAANGSAVINVVYRNAGIYNYSLLSNLGDTLATGTGFEGESLRVGYPRYQLKDGKLYSAAVDNKEYRKTVSLTEDNTSATITYTEKEGVDAVFYKEAEDIEGVNIVTNDNIPVRGSNAKAAKAAGDVTITTLPNGKYKFHLGIFTSKSNYDGFAVKFCVGTDSIFATFGAVNLNEFISEEFTLTKKTAVTFCGANSSADTQFDYIWIEKTGDVPFDPAAAIVNADFSADEPIAQKICTYAKDVQEGQVAQMQPLTGWTIAENGDARAAGTFAYGSTAILGGDGGNVPAAGPNGETEGKALGLEAVWSATTRYTQDVTLPAGEYLFEAVIYNAAGTGALSQNLIGIDDNYCTTKNYPVGKWTKEQVKFTLAEEKSVTISLGINSGNVGNGSAPHLFIDHIKLYGSDEIAAIELAAAKEKALAAIEALPAGEGLFYYSQTDIDNAKAAVNAAETVEAVAAVEMPAPKTPAAEKAYYIANATAEGNLCITEGAITVAKDAKVFFTAVEGGYVLSNEAGDYIFKTTGNDWTLSTSKTIGDAYVVTIIPVEGGYTIKGNKGLFGLDNTAEGSTVYANKAQSNNGLWIIKEGPVDVTNLIVNADLTSTDPAGFDANGTKGIDGSGIVKVGSAAAFDFKQTIANLPAGQYKVTAQAAYRYGADEAAEAAAIAAETDTKLVQLYATVGEKTVSTKVQNRYDGASETDYANGTGSVTVNEKFVPNSSDAVKAWFAAGKYVNELVFNVPADGAVTIGINRTGTPESDYTVIGPWTLTRLGDAEVEPGPEPEPTPEPGADMTKYIVNPSFENGTTGWTYEPSNDHGAKENSNGTYTMTNCDGAHLFNIWSSGNAISQKVEGLPNGTYKLKAVIATDAGQKVQLNANGKSVQIDAVDKGTGVEGELEFNVLDSTATIGAEGVNKYWYKVDNFRLTYVKGFDIADLVTAYETILAEAQAIEGDMNADVKTALNAAIATEVDKTNADALLNATAALTAATSTAKTSVAAYAKAKDLLLKMKQFTEETNVYTAEALASYYTQWAEKYEANTLTTEEADALQDPYAQTGWQHDASMKVDDLLLSAWTIGKAKAKDYETALYINTWSVEGNNDGTNFKVPFFEYWTNDDKSLAADTLTATMSGLEAGDYDVTAWVRVRTKNEAGTEVSASGITMQVNEGEAANVADGATKVALDKNNNFFLKEVTATGTVAADGVLKIKFNVAADNNISWLSFKNVKFEKKAAAIEPIEGISYSWESPAGEPIEWGGTIAYVNGDGNRLNYLNSGYYTICLNGKKANIDDATPSANAGKMVVTLDKAVAEGDTIAYTAYVNKNESKKASAYILFENGTSAEGEEFSDEANIDATFNGVPTLKYTIVPAEAAGSKTITLTRSQSGTNLFITKLQIIEKSELVPTGISTVKNSNLNGTIFNLNGQKVNKAQRGLYIINGKKVVVK